MSASATYTAKELAALAGISERLAYDVAGRETALGRLAIRVGARVVWPRTKVDALLGLAQDGSDA